MSSTIQLGKLLKERHQQRMLPIVTASYLPYKWEVGYRGFNEAIRVTLVSYHRSGMQDASTSNQSLSTTLTLQLLLYSSQIKNKALKQVVNLMNNINKKLTWIRSWLPEKSQRQAKIELGSTNAQAVERAPIGRHLLQTLPLLSISLLFIRLEPTED